MLNPLHAADMADRRSLSARYPDIALMAVIVMAGLLLSAAIIYKLRALEHERLDTEAQLSASEASSGLQRRLDAHAEVLYGLAGLFDASAQGVGREEFRRYIARWQPGVRLEAVQAVQFVRVVPQRDLPEFERRLRSDAALPVEQRSRLLLRPAAGQELHYFIDYTEPLGGNEAVVGVDLGGLPVHKAALERGRDNGKLVATPPARLLQDPSGAPGFVMRLAVYTPGQRPLTEAQRRATLVGFVAVVYRVGDLLVGLLDRSMTERMRIVIHDGGDESTLDQVWQASAENWLYDSDPAAGDSLAVVQTPGVQRRVLEVGGRSWYVFFAPRQGYASTLNVATLVVALGGCLITGLALLLARSWSRSRADARRLGLLSAEQAVVFDNALAGIVVVRDGRLHRCNERFAAILGYRAHELIGRLAAELHPSVEAYQRFEEQLRGKLAVGEPMEFELALRARDAQAVWCAIHGKELPANGSHDTIWVIEDLTAQRAAAEQLAQQHRTAARVNEELRDSVAQLSAQKRLVELLGGMSTTLQSCHSEPEVATVVAKGFAALAPQLGGVLYLLAGDGGLMQQAMRWGRLSAPAERFALQDCWALRRSRPHWGDGLAMQCQHHGACPHLVCLPLMAMNEQVGVLSLEAQPGDWPLDEQFRLVAIAAAEQIAVTLFNLRMRERLHQQAIRDKLTGLRNRRYLDETLPREFARAQREGTPLALALVDVDHFKQFNDRHGHEVGDQVLAAVGRCLDSHTRAADLACRYGGEEFVLLLPHADAAAALLRAEALRATLAAQVLNSGGKALQITASFGIAAYPAHGSDPAQLLAAADAALYEAKRQGRNRVCVAMV